MCSLQRLVSESGGAMSLSWQYITMQVSCKWLVHSGKEQPGSLLTEPGETPLPQYEQMRFEAAAEVTGAEAAAEVTASLALCDDCIARATASLAAAISLGDATR